MSAIAIYSIVTICSTGGSLNSCKGYIGFGDYQPGYSQQACVSQSVALAEKWLKDNRITNRFVSGVVCKLNEERGA